MAYDDQSSSSDSSIEEEDDHHEPAYINPNNATANSSIKPKTKSTSHVDNPIGGELSLKDDETCNTLQRPDINYNDIYEDTNNFEDYGELSESEYSKITSKKTNKNSSSNRNANKQQYNSNTTSRPNSEDLGKKKKRKKP
jgi:hypothetical protein